MRSSCLRSERLLDQLLCDVQPARSWGEPVTAGQPNWVLQRCLGMGSFGEVWLARNKHYTTARAYKFFTRAGTDEFIRREQQNLVEIFNRLGDHPHIIKFLDVMVDGDDDPFIALEYLGGGIPGGLDRRGHRSPRPTRSVRDHPGDRLRTRRGPRPEYRPPRPEAGQHPPHRGPRRAGQDRRFRPGEGRAVGPRRGVGPGDDAQPGRDPDVPAAPGPAAPRRGPPFQDHVLALGIIWYQLIVERIERPPYDFGEQLAAQGLDTHTIGLIERCLAHPGRRFPNAVALELALEDRIPPVMAVLEGMYDVQHLVREYLAALAR